MSALPVSEEVLTDLFNYVARKLASCDHTLHFTCEFIRIHSLDDDRIVSWLESQGGYCDCKVLLNVAACWDNGPEDDDDDDPDPDDVPFLKKRLVTG